MNIPSRSIPHAARKLVRELHLLDGRVGCCGPPLSECHLITELNALGQSTASELCERLVLEKSTMSRLVIKLVAKGPICATCCEHHKWTRILASPRMGKVWAARLEDHASAQVDAALSHVSPVQERITLQGLDLYANSLREERILCRDEERRGQPARLTIYEENLMRVHISIQAKDLERSRAFYQNLFDQPPSKEKGDYLNFRLDQPAIHLALVRSASVPNRGCEHFGIELPSAEIFRAWERRLTKRVPELFEREPGAKCCYAQADKVWLSDPDGNRWEIWHRTGDHSAL